MKFNLRFTLVLSVFLFLLCPSLVFASSQSFSYDFSLPLHAPKGNFKYDANGNLLTSPSGNTYIYDQVNRLIEIKDSTGKTIQKNVYDYSGQRIRKIDYTPQGTITTYYHLAGMEIEISNTNTQPLITITRYLPQGTIQKLTDQENKIYQTYTDHLGSTRLITDDQGNKIEDYDYYPYGTITQPLSPNTSQPTNRLYTSQIKDKTNLYYYNARYYDPSLGIFTSPDQAQGPNRYLYVGGNPIMRSDPSGNAYESGAGGGGNSPNYYHYSDVFAQYSPIPRMYIDYRARQENAVLSKDQGAGVGILDFYQDINQQLINTTGIAITPEQTDVALMILSLAVGLGGPYASSQLQVYDNNSYVRVYHGVPGKAEEIQREGVAGTVCQRSYETLSNAPLGNPLRYALGRLKRSDPGGGGSIIEMRVPSEWVKQVKGSAPITGESTYSLTRAAPVYPGNSYSFPHGDRIIRMLNNCPGNGCVDLADAENFYGITVEDILTPRYIPPEYITRVRNYSYADLEKIMSRARSIFGVWDWK